MQTGVAHRARPIVSLNFLECILATPDAPVFYDPHGRRSRRVFRTGMPLAVVSTIIAATFAASFFINPILPSLKLQPISNSLPKPEDTKLAPTPPPLPATKSAQQAKRAQTELKRAFSTVRFVPAKRPEQMRVTPPPASMPTPKLPAVTKPLAVGFYVNWDDTSRASLKRNLARLDWVVPEWVRLQDGDYPLAPDIDPRALDLIRRERPQLPILPLVQNFQNEEWNSDILAHVVADEPARQRLVNALVQLVDENKFAGVCIDVEEVPPAAQANLYRFMEELHAAFQPRGWLVVQAVPFDNPDWNYKAYAATTDYLFLMAYDQHWSSSEPGPIAAQNWFTEVLARRMHELDPAHTVICLGNYGYDWTQGEKDAPELSFQEAVLAARDSDAEIKFDPATSTPTFKYEEEDGSQHTVWFLDAVTAFNQMHAAAQYHPAGFALWRLGSEDPSLWSVFGTGMQPAEMSAEGLREIRYGYDVDFDGTGEILHIEAAPHNGERAVDQDATSGLVTDEKYDPNNYPSTFVIQRTGDRPGLVALTFDDGPDPVWTPRMLDILKAEHVPATFFVIGEYGQANPDLIRRIVNEGHDIGNHTYSHPNLGEVPSWITDLELTATQRLIESLTGRSTKLFRPPYYGDSEPETPNELEPLVRAEQLGYITVGLHIDPDDWRRPGIDEIVKRTVDGVTNPNATDETRGEVVLLHDGGGDRSETVAALPQIIEQLRAKGYRFVTVSELAGVTQAQTMPPVPQQRGLFARTDALGFYALSTGSWLLHWLFVIGIVLGIGRLLIIGALALAQRLRSRRRELTHAGETYQPFVSVIIPAYKEELVIAKTIKSLLRSDYPAFEIIVVDDGSPDRTSEVVRGMFAGEERVRLFTKENGGKAEALNYGFRRARGEVIIGLDADTIFAPQTIGALAHRFYDPHIGAVAGNAKVGNRINIVTRWQALEYITSQNLDRRAFASLNCITVVPGAVGAWRRELLERAGGFSSDTLAEDQDLTLRVRRLGYKIGYEETAVAWTEAPDTMGGLSKQRFRWSFGTLQCMWKHKDALFRPRYGTLGFIAMPNVWIFQIIFPLITPIMDLMVVWTIIHNVLERLEHPAEQAMSNPKQVLFYYALFLAVDWLSAAFAFLLEKREQWKLLWWLFLQRFGYRQIMYTVMVKSVYMATRGPLVGWGKLERKDTVVVHH
jgi:peptidoglycan-N-acetylglucosamine deacetylase